MPPGRGLVTWGPAGAALTTEATAAVQQLRDLLECVWPAVLAAAGSPFRSKTWCVSLAVVLKRCAGDPQRVRRLGLDRFTAAVRRELPPWHGIRPNLRIVRAVFTALADQHDVTSHRAGARQRAGLVLADWQHTTRRLADTEARMVAVLDELALTELVTSIAGLTPVGAATILAETGDRTGSAAPGPWSSTPVCAPATTAAASITAKAPSPVAVDALRLAAWRAVWAALPNNPVLAAKFTDLTTREHNRLARRQARTACAAALLRWLHVVITQRVTWSPVIAAGGRALNHAA